MSKKSNKTDKVYIDSINPFVKKQIHTKSDKLQIIDYKPTSEVYYEYQMYDTKINNDKCDRNCDRICKTCERNYDKWLVMLRNMNN